MALPSDDAGRFLSELSDDVPLRWSYSSTRAAWLGIAADSGEVLIVIPVDDAYAMRDRGGAFPKTARRPRAKD